MPRNKRGQSTPRGAKGGRATRGGRGGARGRGRFSNGPSPAQYTGEIVGFTLADEARQTSQHDHSWANSSLRLKPVAFVSAGPTEPLKILNDELEEVDSGSPAPADEEDDEKNLRKESSETVKSPNEEEEEESDQDFIGPEELETAINPEPEAQDESEFFFDLKGEQSHRQTYTEPVHIPERPISRSSSSSDEVILFKGREAQRQPKSPATIDLVQIQAEIEVVEEEIRVAKETVPLPSKARKNKRNQRRKEPHMNDDDAILADYIANMRENGEADDLLMAHMGNQRDLGGTDGEIVEDSSSDEDGEDLATSKDGKSGEDLDAEAPDEMDDESASELDDETLAKLIAGHEFGMEDVNLGDSSSDSDSSDDDKKLDKNRSEIIDDFDLMDWHRPSLRRKKGKGARAQINFNVSDSELERTLQMAWKNDRMKKSERKKQREQLRALGMLGKKSNPEDLRVKYPQGMDMEQVGEELRTFLLSSAETLALPPMDNHARKMIHEIANKFKIKSKSTGSANQRRPVLYRTLRTLPYVEASFDQTMSRTTRKYLPRLDVKGKRAKRALPSRSAAAAAGYQDGEIVGGAAPELGVQNRGRAMLEKMGWSSGTALGAMNNKGILLPVTHAMKSTKAGLG